MKISSLVWSEIAHRKLSFCIAILAIVVAVASCVSVVTLIHAYQLRTQQRVAALDDEIRKITKNMGFNITILPKQQNLADFYAADFADKTMPMEYVRRLAESPEVVTINHLRPALIKKTDWPERNRQVLLMGVSGVVPFVHRDKKKPLAEPVPPGTINLGHVLARELDIQENDEVGFRGETFRVGKIYPPRGSKDDITVWIDLPAVQSMLEMEGRINMIQALECNCATIDRLAEIQREVSVLLDNDVQVIEMSDKAIGRAKARNQVRAAGVATVARIERLGKMLLPLAILGAGAIVGMMTLANVRERRAEIGILRALGVRSRQVLSLFLTKALLLGFVGALIGYACGFQIAWLCQPASETPQAAADLLLPTLLITVLALTPALSLLASWLPSLFAAAQDPAVVLREE